ncbi:hypothetical protein HKD37_04G011733 [Glycine soja]|uniref:Uncharacterized protein n=1 Tax=Glycine soja TaxID=3848 RepID=A0A0B2SJ21_GLYSO|nr:hypothetical protein glysoja_024512 [Glycine soja]RZC18179.1 hypothetical protein D0Y65_010709 [Glycine soja]
MMRKLSICETNTKAEQGSNSSKKNESGNIEPWHKPKNGSVIPANRKSVKKLMCECIVTMCCKCSKKIVPSQSATNSE